MSRILIINNYKCIFFSNCTNVFVDNLTIRSFIFFYMFQINYLSLLHDKYVIVSADKAPNNIGCVCKSHYIDCLATLHIPPRHLRKRKSWTIVSLCYVPLEFQSKMKNWIYRHSTGFLNYTSVLSNSAMLLGMPNAPRNLFPNY
jgi:hypothetical protein